MTDAWTMRLASPVDADALIETLRTAFEGFGSFAPAGWRPDDPAEWSDDLRERLASGDTWCLVALLEGEMAGHVSFLPAATARRPDLEPGLAHLWQLFVRPPFWGSALATELLRRCVAEAGARGFTQMRLYTPAGNARARRFYEREGWRTVGETEDDPNLGLPIVQYRRRLDQSL